MKKNIHPKYIACKVHCGCGSSWETRSTQPEIKVEICSACHPFFRDGSGGKILDTLGRVDRFTKKFGGEYFAAKPAKAPAKPARR